MARKFRFRLEAVRRLRQEALESQRRTIASLVRGAGRIRERIDQLSEQIASTADRARDAQRSGVIDLRSLSGLEFHRAWLHAKLLESQHELTQQEIQLRAERHKLAERWKEVRVIEQLREKQWRRHTAELARDERLLADEAALNVYLQGRSGQHDEVAA